MSHIPPREVQGNLDLLKPTDRFVNRHIGPKGEAVDEMVKTVGFSSLDDLIDEAVPDVIRMEGTLDLPEPRSESEVLADLRALAEKNKVFRSFIGMGYYDCLV
ncbi:MAG: hypothetical protein R3248_12265, partial [Candidatus Promineifilaceae bacterium]|nr:hypothetical protein [Candidatus Promineifilaceae bacterium]